ncbi:hypothetical protein HanPI659440_Chr14g0548931 [Helianthus annuus]|nr:hypothetical protein HanPI659440_Chr14g0548931 [Helianthus annuus]
MVIALQRFSFMIANAQFLNFLINSYVTHALFVAHVVRLIREDHQGLHSKLLFYRCFKYYFAILGLCIVIQITYVID